VDLPPPAAERRISDGWISDDRISDDWVGDDRISDGWITDGWISDGWITDGWVGDGWVGDGCIRNLVKHWSNAGQTLLSHLQQVERQAVAGVPAVQEVPRLAHLANR
jgi:hypothetical protein